MGSSLDYAWQEQSVWSQAADKLSADLRLRRRTALGLAVAGAVLSTSAASVGLDTGLGKALAFLSAACVGCAAIAQTSAGPKAVQEWTRARAASEAIKSDVYLTLAGFGPDDLDTAVQLINDDAADLHQHRAGLNPKVRTLPSVHDVPSYLDERVNGQIEHYYEKRVRRLKATLQRLRWSGTGLAVIGVLLGAAAGTWEIDGLAVWVPVTTTVGAAVVAHAAAERYSYLLIEFSRTADELRRIRERRGAAAGLSDERLVQRAEQVISIQNNGWLAKLTATEN